MQMAHKGVRRGGMVATNGLDEPREGGPERLGAAVRRVADVRSAGHVLGEPADRDHEAAARDTFEEEGGGFHLAARRPPVRIRTIGLVWMWRGHVPDQHLVF